MLIYGAHTYTVLIHMLMLVLVGARRGSDRLGGLGPAVLIRLAILILVGARRGSDRLGGLGPALTERRRRAQAVGVPRWGRQPRPLRGAL